MRLWKRAVLVAGVGAAVAAGVFAREAVHQKRDAAAAASVATGVAGAQAGLPRLIEFSSVRCLPCSAMAPIMEQLKQAAPDKFSVEVIDIDQHHDVAVAYKAVSVPLLVFLDGNGKELFRHFGFWPKSAILDKWRELGVEWRSGDNALKGEE